MARTTITIETRDGRPEASVFTPDDGKGPWPGVIFYMDGIGIRPTLFEMGERIASGGYVVLLPDLFYRVGPYTAPEPAKLFSDPEVRAGWMKFIGSVNQANAMSDTSAFLDYLASRPDVKQPLVGTTGYCMGGGLSLAAAGFYPERVAAAASFHGGRLATDAPESPHRLAPKMKARVYVAGAVEDPSFPAEQKQLIEESLSAAKVEHTVVTYEGCRHGWVPSDTPVHNREGAERHYEALFALFADRLN
jgi:carboxymethylenebutenolidase